MNYTEQPEREKIIRSKKMMMWFGIISLSMMFAGLTSAYIVSKERRDWLADFELPQAFYISTAIIILSSITLHISKISVKKENFQPAKILTLVTAALGVAFMVFQFRGFDEMFAQGYYPTGDQSTINTSFIYIFVVTHIAHLLAGIVVLTVVLIQLFRNKYTEGETLGFDLATTFWHFVDFLWIYLLVFLLISPSL